MERNIWTPPDIDFYFLSWIWRWAEKADFPQELMTGYQDPFSSYIVPRERFAPITIRAKYCEIAELYNFSLWFLLSYRCAFLHLNSCYVY